MLHSLLLVMMLCIILKCTTQSLPKTKLLELVITTFQTLSGWMWKAVVAELIALAHVGIVGDRPSVPAEIMWGCTGATLALMQEGVGIYLWDVPSEPNASAPTQPLRLAPTITIATSFCAWSKKFQQLAIGTNAGKVIIFNKPQGVMQLHDRKGKHGAAVTCGDWLVDNRLGLASGTRVKISKPLPEHGAQWESYSKFKLSGIALPRAP